MEEKYFKVITNYRTANRLELRKFTSCDYCMYKIEDEEKIGGKCTFLYRGIIGDMFDVDLFDICSKFEPKKPFTKGL